MVAGPEHESQGIGLALGTAGHPFCRVLLVTQWQSGSVGSGVMRVQLPVKNWRQCSNSTPGLTLMSSLSGLGMPSL